MATGTTTLRVPTDLRDEIAALAEERGTTMLEVVADAIRRLRRDQWWVGVHTAIERLEPGGLATYRAEAELLDDAARDGLG